MTRSARYLLALAGIAIALAAGCSGKGSKTSQTTLSRSAPLPQQLPVVTISHAVVADGSGSPVYTVDVRGPVIVLDAKDQLLTTSMPTRGRRRYTLAGKDQFEARSTTNGFSVAVPGGATKWTVATTKTGTELLQGDTKKLYALVSKDPSHIGVLRGSKSVGSVEKQADGSSVVKDAKGNVVAKVTDGKFSAAYGAMLMSELPDIDRGVIVSELLAAKK